ncbi:3-hydroxyacyl-CoA dehydrogenase NAD-binding domain-containing protein [Rhodovulum sp. DZ06]|uniref:3-hydroxyacyl-CoA dehydrogenase NAD-binding domain-containing protein n=1 Tax=Rhodovulum sp. DZ06 TaxID=3425126 RepID=UPI003D326A62
MSGPVSYAKDGDIAVISIDNPPVNALGQGVRQGLVDAMDQFDADDSAKIAVIVGEGRTFPAGADISEFGKPPTGPALPDVATRIERATKPVVASIHGTSLGGGLEISMGAHYRIAQNTAKVGLPEIHLGIFPGAGGMIRAPKLIGFEKTLEIVHSGRHVKAPEALGMGLIDVVDESGDAKAAGIAYAKKLLEEGAGVRRTTDLPLENPGKDWFDAARAAAAKKARGLMNFVEAVNAAEGALMPVDEGMKHEREHYMKCHMSSQRAGMVHAFFSERAVAKVPEAKVEPRPLKQIGVIGGGTMGAGITAAALNAGLSVVMVEMNPEAVARGEANLRRNYASSVAKGRMTQEALDGLIASKMTFSDDYAAMSDCDLIIEAVFEKMEVKKEVFGKIDAIAKPGAVLASNTSYLNIDEIAAATSRPQDVLGLHFFSPAHIMRLLEVVVGEKTLPEVAATGFALGRMMKKVAVRSGVCDGFIGNRILAKYMTVANYMVEDGASPYLIDEAVREFGYPMGPFQMGDLAGLDIGYFNRQGKAADRNPNVRYGAGFLDEMYHKGWLGQKTEIGFYDYAGGARSGPPNPGIMPLIEAEREKLGVEPREFTKEEIMRRYIAAMTNEAAKVVGEGIALRPLDVDMTALFGYGYPRWRGGPMHYADEVGLDKILADIREFEKEDSHFWTPAPLLVQLVEEGKKFADLNNA